MTSEQSSRSEMPKAYEPASVEGRLYKMWEDAGYFLPSEGDGDPFTIIMPPPNLTGELHVGHALMDTVEDILIRWHRMRGEPTLWVPGIDHAAIAVHTLVERKLAEEGVTRFDIGREKFLERVWDFVNTSRSRIFDQHKRLGASADWTREGFTMDEGPRKAVRAVFYKLYQAGLIYRGERLINWCPGCQTAISDLEVKHRDEQGTLWHVRYPMMEGDGSITIATTRPETIVADTGIAVHPDDERYQDLVGKQARLPIIDRGLPVVADDVIDRSFGTGALKVTPGHDPIDFDIGQRHGLAVINSIEKDGSMSSEAGPYAGMDRFACREAIVRDLEEQGFLVKTEPHTHSVGHCERCDTIVEPLISLQWFVAVNKEYGDNAKSIAGEALRVVNDGRIEFAPRRFTRDYVNWMENIRDWCISRQLWWGHRIPVWYCDDCGQTTVPPPEAEEPEACDGCGGTNLRQDEDTLDTWFSSALWPCSTLGWPDESDDLKRFYPTTVMETGYEIIFFWVARMIMMGLFCMDDLRDKVEDRIPFKYVYLHGMVRDDKGAKMSKTKGNVVDPIELIEKYGTDALRFNLITGGGTGQDQRLWEEKVEAGRNFANKLWNASRFVIMQLDQVGEGVPPMASRDSMPAEDRWVLSKLDRLVDQVDTMLNEFQLNEAARHIYDFLWGDYCDWYLEMAKVRLRSDDQTPLPVLAHVLETGLRLLHPFMPFVTEELWQRLHDVPGQEAETAALMVANFPKSNAQWQDEHAERDIDEMIDVVRAIRNIRSERKVEPAKFIEAYVVTEDGSNLGSSTTYIEALARVRPLTVVTDAAAAPREGVATAVLSHAQAVVPLSGMVDAGEERDRLGKEIEETEAYIKRLDGKLSNKKFRSRAPADVVAAEQGRRDEAQSKLDGLNRALTELG